MFQRLIEGIYMPHGYCLLWDPWLVTLHAASDILTFGAYSAIPLAIWMFVSKRPYVEMRGLAMLFAAFILWCGLTHVFNVITLWYPVYELQGFVKGITAAVSVTTAVMIFPLIPKALAIPSPNELQLANAQLQQEIGAHRVTLQDLQKARDELERRVAERTKDLEEATERFKALFEHAPVAMLMVDRDGTLKQANAAAESLFNCDRQGLLGEPIKSLLPEGLHSELQGRMPSAQSMDSGSELYARRKDGHQFPVEIGVKPVPGEDQSTFIASIVDISGRRKEEQRIQFIMRELSHRSKNLLAVIQGMVRQALASSSDLLSFERSFGERLQGMARSHDLLVGKNWEGTSISELVHAQMAILKTADPSTISVQGPPVFLAPEAAQNVGLALHELATNAIKHGAVAGHAGTISVSWRVDEPSGPSPRLILSWLEKGAVVNAEPSRRGFGRTVLDRVVPASLGGSAKLAFDQGGVSWTLDVPLSSLERRAREPAAAA